MAKKYRSGVYLGETRRQRVTRLRTVTAIAALVLVTILGSVFFVSWLLDRAEEPDTGRKDPAAEVQSDRISDTEMTQQPPIETPTPTTEAQTPPAATDPDPIEELRGTAYKPLDYTQNWSIMIDPGHGFDDIGTSSALLGDVNEATINLDIALRVRELLAEHSDIMTIMTHDDNAVDGRISAADGGEPPLNHLVLLTPEDRAALGNGQDIDLFVSIHCDSLPSNSDVSGMRVYYYDSGETDTPLNRGREALAAHIANQFGLHMDDDAPIPMIKTMTEDNAFYVIKKMDVPSVLCEVGFVTNTTDAANMLDEAWRQAAAMGIAEGILAYVSDAAKMAPEE